MALINKFSIFILFTLLSSLHIQARDSQFFNKVPSTTTTTTTNVVVPNNNNNEQQFVNQQPEQQQPEFQPENENGAYGLYGHETGQLPPSAKFSTVDTTTVPQYDTVSNQPLNKHLPKNYNPVAYVTEPEDTNDNIDPTFTQEKSFTTNYNNAAQNYYNDNTQQQRQQPQQEQQQFQEYRNYPSATKNTRNNNNLYNDNTNYYNADNSIPQGTSLSGRSATFTNGGATTFHPQGMSDTRFMENGKYHYDINSEKYSENHPYQSFRSNEQYGNRNFMENNQNAAAYEFNNDESLGGYQNQDEFQEEDNAMP